MVHDILNKDCAWWFWLKTIIIFGRNFKMLKLFETNTILKGFFVYLD